MSFKEFVKPTTGKIVLTIILQIIQISYPTLLALTEGNYNSYPIEYSIIRFQSIFMNFLTILIGLLVLIILYFIASSIIYFFTKSRSKQIQNG